MVTTGIARFEWPIEDAEMSLGDLKREALERAAAWLIQRRVQCAWNQAKFMHNPRNRTLRLTVPTVSPIRAEEGGV